jgi:hypothetical protein
MGRFRTDTDGDATLDSVETSLTAADIAALETPGTATDRVDASGTYTNGDYSSQFILLSDTVALDFTRIDNTAFSNVEYLDMKDGNSQTVTLDGSEVISLTSAANELIILGDATSDTVHAIGFADTGKDQSIQGRRFSIYEADVGDPIATLIIEDGIMVTLA